MHRFFFGDRQGIDKKKKKNKRPEDRRGEEKEARDHRGRGDSDPSRRRRCEEARADADHAVDKEEARDRRVRGDSDPSRHRRCEEARTADDDNAEPDRGGDRDRKRKRTRGQHNSGGLPTPIGTIQGDRLAEDERRERGSPTPLADENPEPRNIVHDTVFAIAPDRCERMRIRWPISGGAKRARHSVYMEPPTADRDAAAIDDRPAPSASTAPLIDDRDAAAIDEREPSTTARDAAPSADTAPSTPTSAFPPLPPQRRRLVSPTPMGPMGATCKAGGLQTKRAKFGSSTTSGIPAQRPTAVPPQALSTPDTPDIQDCRPQFRPQFMPQFVPYQRAPITPPPKGCPGFIPMRPLPPPHRGTAGVDAAWYQQWIRRWPGFVPKGCPGFIPMRPPQPVPPVPPLPKFNTANRKRAARRQKDGPRPEEGPQPPLPPPAEPTQAEAPDEVKIADID